LGTGANLSWETDFLTAYYSYNYSEGNNSVSGSESINDSHFGKVETTASFWQDKGSVTLSQQYSYSKNESSSRTTAGVALIELSMASYTATQDPTDNTVPGSNAALTNDSKTDSAVTVNNPGDPNRLNISIKSNFQQADTIYLYTDSDITAPVSAEFIWDLYSSSDNSNWTLEKAGVTATYSSTDTRFEIDTSGYSKDYLKLVASSDPAATLVTFSEIEVYQQVNSTDSMVTIATDVTNYITDLNLSLELIPDLNLSTSASYEQNEYSSSANQKSSRFSSTISWDPNEFFKSSLTGSITSRKRETDLEEQTRTYSLHIEVPPLPSIDTAFGATMSETYRGQEHLTTNYLYSLDIVADLYTDLDSRFNFQYDQSDDQIKQTSWRHAIFPHSMPF